MKNATIKSIEFAADTINEEISNFTPGDLQFGAMLDIVATVVAKRHEARDDDATFSEIRREILKSLMKDGRWPSRIPARPTTQSSGESSSTTKPHAHLPVQSGPNRIAISPLLDTGSVAIYVTAHAARMAARRTGRTTDHIAGAER